MIILFSKDDTNRGFSIYRFNLYGVTNAPSAFSHLCDGTLSIDTLEDRASFILSPPSNIVSIKTEGRIDDVLDFLSRFNPTATLFRIDIPSFEIASKGHIHIYFPLLSSIQPPYYSFYLFLIRNHTYLNRFHVYYASSRSTSFIPSSFDVEHSDIFINSLSHFAQFFPDADPFSSSSPSMAALLRLPSFPYPFIIGNDFMIMHNTEYFQLYFKWQGYSIADINIADFTDKLLHILTPYTEILSEKDLLAKLAINPSYLDALNFMRSLKSVKFTPYSSVIDPGQLIYAKTASAFDSDSPRAYYCRLLLKLPFIQGAFRYGNWCMNNASDRRHFPNVRIYPIKLKDNYLIAGQFIGDESFLLKDLFKTLLECIAVSNKLATFRDVADF